MISRYFPRPSPHPCFARGLWIRDAPVISLMIRVHKSYHYSGFLDDFRGVALSPRDHIANGSHLSAAGKGLVRTSVHTADGALSFMNIDTLFVPGITARLFSLRKACEARASLTFDTNGFIRRDSEVIPIEDLRSFSQLPLVMASGP